MKNGTQKGKIIVAISVVMLLAALILWNISSENQQAEEDTPADTVSIYMDNVDSQQSTDLLEQMILPKDNANEVILQSAKDFLKAYYTIRGAYTPWQHFEDYREYLSEQGKQNLAIPPDSNEEVVSLESGIHAITSFVSEVSEDIARTVSFLQLESKVNTSLPTKACYMVVLDLRYIDGKWMVDNMPINQLMDETDLSTLFQ
ncbi:hypothetical protein [Massilioclostridium coli]|uniref:hypothetical protein n=1 Tax=Massilioclostridium coli TaxID=1870991 RepID=UPI0022E59CA9|nr:hypothetical protein [Massilioclostridium coli]